MAVQLIPLIKALAPYLATIATSAIPAFTSKPEAARSDPIVARQISELQDAATRNARELHTFAEHLQKLIASADEAAAVAERQIKTYKMLLFASLTLSLASFVTAIFAVTR